MGVHSIKFRDHHLRASGYEPGAAAPPPSYCHPCLTIFRSVLLSLLFISWLWPVVVLAWILVPLWIWTIYILPCRVFEALPFPPHLLPNFTVLITCTGQDPEMWNCTLRSTFPFSRPPSLPFPADVLLPHIQPLSRNYETRLVWLIIHNWYSDVYWRCIYLQVGVPWARWNRKRNHRKGRQGSRVGVDEGGFVEKVDVISARSYHPEATGFPNKTAALSEFKATGFKLANRDKVSVPYDLRL